MGKKQQKDEEKKEKPIFGSGAEPLPEPKDDGLVKCVCTVPCAWRGYHDEGDRVFVDRKLLERDPFFKGHFKPLEPLAGQGIGDIGGGEGGSTGRINNGDNDANVSQEHENNGDPGNGASVNNDNANGTGDNANGGTDNANGTGDNANGGTDNANGTGDEVGGKGSQGELGLN